MRAKGEATPLSEMLSTYDGTNGQSRRAYWPQQKMFFELFRLELQKTLDWKEAAKSAYARTYNNHRFYTFIRWPKIWERIREIVLEEFEEAGLTRTHVAKGLKEAFDAGSPADKTRIARLFYEIEGEIGSSRAQHALPQGEAIDFTEVVQQALRGMPVNGTPTLVSHVPLGGISGSELPIPSGDCESPGRPEEEAEGDHCSEGLLKDDT